jgi:hypothetical protein
MRAEITALDDQDPRLVGSPHPMALASFAGRSRHDGNHNRRHLFAVTDGNAGALGAS